MSVVGAAVMSLRGGQLHCTGNLLLVSSHSAYGALPIQKQRLSNVLRTKQLQILTTFFHLTSQSSTSVLWNKCPHGKIRITSPRSKLPRQMEHSSFE